MPKKLRERYERSEAESKPENKAEAPKASKAKTKSGGAAKSKTKTISKITGARRAKTVAA